MRMMQRTLSSDLQKDVNVSSPPSIALPLSSSSRSHGYFLSAKNLAQSFCQLVIKHGGMYLSEKKWLFYRERDAVQTI